MTHGILFQKAGCTDALASDVLVRQAPTLFQNRDMAATLLSSIAAGQARRTRTGGNHAAHAADACF